MLHFIRTTAPSASGLLEAFFVFFMEINCTLQTHFTGFQTALLGLPWIVRFWIGINFSVTGLGRSGTVGDRDVDLAESVWFVSTSSVPYLWNLRYVVWKINVVYGIFGFHMENKRSAMEFSGTYEKKTAIFMEKKI